MPRSLLVAVPVVAVGMLASGRALAWQEAHEIGDDVAVRVDAAGVADVEHRVRWHVVRGPLKSIDLVNVDPSAEVEPAVVITGDDGRSLTAHAAHHDEHTVRVTIGEPRAMTRGSFTFSVRWRLDLVAAHALGRDGATWRLTWSAPVATDGFDAAKTAFTLPAAPDAPVAILPDTGAVDDAAVSSVRRDPGTDVLELVRPHVARGEAPVWTIRLDPRALPLVADPTLRPPSEAKPPPEPDRIARVSAAAAFLALAAIFALLVLGRARAFGAACAAKGRQARGLLPLAAGTRAVLAGAALAGGVAFELRDQVMAGAACVAIAVLAAALRAPQAKVSARGPGKWLAIKPADAFAPGPRATATQAVAVVAALAAIGAAAFVASRFSAEGPWLAALDGAALVPLFVTGRSTQLPPDLARDAAPWLSRVFSALGRVASLRVSPWARFAIDAVRPDELRVLVLPRAAMPGLLGMEIGLAWSATPVGWAATPEVLARYLEGSAAATRIARDLPHAGAVPGRRPDERVARLRPLAPTRRRTVALVRALAEALTDRRVELEAWTGPERRGADLPHEPAASSAGRPVASASPVACSL